MNGITFQGNEIVFQEEVEVFGERQIEELSVQYPEREEFELELDTGGYVSLETFIDVERGDGGDIESLALQFDQLPSVTAAIRRRETDSEDDLPPVPNVDLSEINVGSRRNFYKRMRDSPESQPAQIRRLIHEHRELEREEFDRLVEEELGYTADGGGTNMCLVVLENLTEEIERHGRGSEQRIVWTG